MSEFEKLYLKILLEEVSSVTFTPNDLLDDIRKKCFYSHGEVIYYTLDELNEFKDDKNKPLFSLLLKNLKNKHDYSILIVYFTSLNQIDELMESIGYTNPHMNYPNFSLKQVHKQFKKFFNINNKSGVNFNSIDICPELGCVIGINGEKIHSIRDFEKEVDHELNHYFEKMNIVYQLDNYVDFVSSSTDSDILNKLEEFYGIDIKRKSNYIADLLYHLFNYQEFRSMCANVFHEILNYNETHIKELQFSFLLNDIKNCNYEKYSKIEFQEAILFSWICFKLSESRWDILLEGIKEALSIKKNIFEKFCIRGKNLIRKFFISKNKKK